MECYDRTIMANYFVVSATVYPRGCNHYHRSVFSSWFSYELIETVRLTITFFSAAIVRLHRLLDLFLFLSLFFSLGVCIS